VSPSPSSPVALLAREGKARLAVADGWAAGFEAVEAAARAGWLPAMSPGLARARFVNVTFRRARAAETRLEAASRRILCRVCLKDEEVVTRAGLASAAVALHAAIVSAAVRGAVDVVRAGAAVIRLAAVRALPPLSLSPSPQAAAVVVPLSPCLLVALPVVGASPSGGTVAAESPPPRPPAADARAVVLLSGASGEAVVSLAGARRARSSGPSQEHQRLVRRGDVLLPAPSASLQPRRSVTP